MYGVQWWIKFRNLDAKVSFFFPPEKIGGYSLTHFGQFLFFFRVLEKKNKLIFFFQEKFACHSLSWETVNLQKKVKNGKKWHLLSNFIFFVVFFPKKTGQDSVFFSQEKFTRHSLTRFQKKWKKNQVYFFFFSSRFFWFWPCVFFRRKSLNCTRSVKIRGWKKKTKNSVGQQKKRIFTHSLEFYSTVVKNKLFRGNEKNPLLLPWYLIQL